MSNAQISRNTLVTRALAALKDSLPSGWAVRRLRPPASAKVDAVFDIRAPDGTSRMVLVEAKPQLTARQASELGPRLLAAARDLSTGQPLVVTRFATEQARERLESAGLSLLDLTGNMRIHLERPGLFIAARGADQDPSPPVRGVRSLKGAKAGRIVRALCDWRPAVGIRDLAGRAGTNPGYTSRVVKLLEEEDLLNRDNDGRIHSVDWRGLLRRWSRDYDVAKSNRAVPFLSPRGLPAFTDRLRSYGPQYALTGSLAVPHAASVAPARLASCYVHDPETTAERLDLRSVEVGANILLLEPFDSVVYERTREEAGLTLVSNTQCAVDLMTGTGREPAEAESLVSWMVGNEGEWRV